MAKHITVTLPTTKRPDSLVRAVKSIDIDCTIGIVYVHDTDIPDEIKQDRRCALFKKPEVAVTQAMLFIIDTFKGDILTATDDIEYMAGAITLAQKALKEKLNDFGVVGMLQQNIGGSCPYSFTLTSESYVEKYGHFNTQYKHLFADGQFGVEAEARGLFYFEKEAKLNHYHPAVTGAYDATHDESRQKWFAADMVVYRDFMERQKTKEVVNG